MDMESVSIKALIKQYLPDPVQNKILGFRESIRRTVNVQRYRGDQYYCPICEREISEYILDRDIALCPVCDSSERHRVDWLFLCRHTDLFDEKPRNFLHVAPELFLTKRFSGIQDIEYSSIDLVDARAMFKMDLTDIDFPDNNFDVVYCSRVLEYIEDDRKAINELLRVTKPGGWGLLQVSIKAENTFEDPLVVTPEERACQYGDKGHMRLCGVDYLKRIHACGWDTKMFHASDFMSDNEFEKFGILDRDRYVFYCRKPYQ
jgi:hypothetical protein